MKIAFPKDGRRQLLDFKSGTDALPGDCAAGWGLVQGRD
jgi:hypothetical protein